MPLADLLEGMTPETRISLDRMLKQVRKTGDASVIDELYAVDYDRVPVDARTFLEDEYYLGASVRGLSPRWKQEFCEIFAPDSTVTTLILTGAIGGGKSTFAALCLARKLYELSCLKDPALFYGLLARSKIVLGIYSITLDKADDTQKYLKRFIDDSPYFKECCPRKVRPDEPTYFPSKNLEVSVGSLATHALGDNILGFVLDEGNFFKKAKAGDNPNEKTRAHQLCTEAKSRIASRFSKYGSVPGFVILISSRKFQSSFLDEEIEKATADPMIAKTTRVVSIALWQVKPAEEFSGESFEVIVGTEQYPSRVLEQDELPPEDAKTIRVPEEFRVQFTADADLALRDIAGVSTAGSRAFFPVMDRVRSCIDRSRKHPFTKPDLAIGFGSGREVSDYVEERLMARIDHSNWQPIVNPGAVRHIHFDLALSQECVGIVMGHAAMTPEALEGAYIDFMLRIRAPAGAQIDLGACIRFAQWLRTRGYRIDDVTFDQYQSALPIQLLVQAGFNASRLSVGLMHYHHLKVGYNERRVMMYEYQPQLEEAEHLLRDPEGLDRPHHAEGWFDDVMDAKAAVFSRCYRVASTALKQGKTSKDRVSFAGRGDHGPVIQRVNVGRGQEEFSSGSLPSMW